MQYAERRKKLKRNQGAVIGSQPMRVHRGTSLVEILVVLAILTIGIFAIIRIFPEGFVSIRGSGNATKAQGLTDVLTDFLRKNQENLPDGILALNPANGAILPNVHPLDMQSNWNYSDNPLTNGPAADPRFSQANRARRVVGETVKIAAPTANFLPRASYTGPGNLGAGNSEALVSVHQALFAPLYTLDAYPAANNAAQGIDVYSATPHTRVVFQNPPTTANNDELIARDLFGYGINYQLGRLLFTAQNANARFRCEFAYDSGGGNIVRGNIQVTVPAAQTPWGGFSYYTVDLVTLGVLPAGAEIYPGSDVLYRCFDRLSIDQPFNVKNDAVAGANPYEFKVYDRVSGLFGFNPEASTTPLASREGRGLSARIDYDVDDWQILHQDVEVPRVASDPAGTYFAVKLFTNRIKKIGDLEEEIVFQTSQAGGGPVTSIKAYEGLIRYYPSSAVSAARAGTPGLEVAVVDLATGLQIDNRTLVIGGNNSNGELNHSLGIIQLRQNVLLQLPYDMGSTPMVAPVDIRGRTLRVYFRHKDHFTMAVEKPFSNYQRELSAPAAMGAGEFFHAPLGYLLFPLADADKTVAVDYLWRDATTGEQRRDVGEMLRVKLPDPGGVEDPGTGTAWVRVANADCGTGNCNPDVEPNSIRVIGVRGVSIRTHVAWRESPRWRHLRRTAMLSREVTR